MIGRYKGDLRLGEVLGLGEEYDKSEIRKSFDKMRER